MLITVKAVALETNKKKIVKKNIFREFDVKNFLKVINKIIKINYLAKILKKIKEFNTDTLTHQQNQVSNFMNCTLLDSQYYDATG
jgi:signal recognition particle GTPase